MTLMYGTAPLGPDAPGRFNFTRKGPAAALYWEPFAKRVRAEFGGAIVADSRSVQALHETGQFMAFYFPRGDVDMNWLRPTDHSSECPHKGVASYWSIEADGRVAENVAWTYNNPVESASWLSGYISFDYKKMDAWYQEDDRIYAHPRDPYHRIDIHHASRSVVVSLGDLVVARSDRPRTLFETGLPPRFYLPPTDVRLDLLERSTTVSQCPYKGDGQHWHLRAGADYVEDAAWSLPRPLGEAQEIVDYICFYADKVRIEVDGKPLDG